MEKSTRTKIETYNKVDLFYDKDDGLVYFDFEGRERRANYVFEAYRVIDEPVWEPCDLEGYFIDGTFSDFVGKAKALRKNIKNGLPDWKYKGRFDSDYKSPNYSTPSVYLFSEKNDAIYEEYEKQRDVVLSEERKLKNIIGKLKTQKDTTTT